MKNIKEFLPQREPFLFVDSIIEAQMDLIVAEKHFAVDFPFAAECPDGQKYLPLPILVEALVQSGGAGMNMTMAGQRGIFVLASLERVKMRGIVTTPATVTMKIKTLKVTGKILKQTGKVDFQDKLVLRATWNCILLPGCQ